MSSNAIEVTSVDKSFRLPLESFTTLRDTITHPRRARASRELKVLEDISFEVRRGEFFGVVGRNGCGKSTLLKLLASIYRPDSGRIRIAGRIAPFIELGVGFNHQLSAFDNVVMNGVMMGLSRKEAKARFDRVMDFAELREFATMPLKNYSSGMQVRLAFSVMLEVEADVLLFDEVLAVGDAAFTEKCDAALERFRNGPETVILVTHSMPAVENYCDRVMLLERGQTEVIGVPDDVVGRYLEIGSPHAPEGSPIVGEDLEAVSVEPVGRELPADGPVEIGVGEEIAVRVELASRTGAENVSLGFEIQTVSGVRVYSSGPFALGERGERLGAREKVSAVVRIENRFGPGRYLLRAWPLSGEEEPLRVAPLPGRMQFEIGEDPDARYLDTGLVRVEQTVEVER